MQIVTNFERFPAEWRSSQGRTGRSVEARTDQDFLRQSGPGAIWLINCDPGRTFRLAWQKPRRGVRLVAADLVLRAGRGWKHLLRQPIQKRLLGRVDHFIHYFQDWGRYEREFGLPGGRSSFVPFKVNLVDRFQVAAAPEGDYALCIGRSMRDFDTFLGAMEKLPQYPGAITQPNYELMGQHGSRFTWPLDRLPANVRVLDDDGSDESMIRLISGAKMVVMPVLKNSLVASGISTGLNAMSLGKCVIGTEGPGMLDVFRDGEVLVAPPEDPAALASLIDKVWTDEGLRRRTAEAGYRYAGWAGGEPQLYQRIIEGLVELFPQDR